MVKPLSYRVSAVAEAVSKKAMVNIKIKAAIFIYLGYSLDPCPFLDSIIHYENLIFRKETS